MIPNARATARAAVRLSGGLVLVRCLLTATILALWVPVCADTSETLSLGLEAPALGSQAPTPGKAPEAATQSAPEKQPQEVTVKVGRVGMVQVAGAAIYRSRSSKAGKFTTVKSQTPLAIVDEQGEWYGVLMINGAVGWIPRSSVKMTGYDLVAQKPDPSRGTTTSRGGQVDRTGVVGDSMIRTAMQYSGVNYVYGGNDPATGMDCSAFVRMIFGQYGFSLPRTAREQATVGTTVPFDQLQPGDRLYFQCRNSYIDHCGIYAGNGYFVHCSAGRNGVGVDSLASDYYWRSLVVAKRS